MVTPDAQRARPPPGNPLLLQPPLFLEATEERAPFPRLVGGIVRGQFLLGHPSLCSELTSGLSEGQEGEVKRQGEGDGEEREGREAGREEEGNGVPREWQGGQRAKGVKDKGTPGPRFHSLPFSYFVQLSLTVFRAGHPQISHVGIVIILN